jgi:hypothetical protein
MKLSNALFSQEKIDWLQTILFERFGVFFAISECRESENSVLCLALDQAEEYIVFDRLQHVFNESRSDFPCALWNAEREGFSSVLLSDLPAPGILVSPSPLVEKTNHEYRVHYDILGLTCWMLSRREEIGRNDLDEHNRFPAKYSHAFLHHYLERPIVDEWLDILRQLIQRVWPQLKLKRHQFEIKVSHDVDAPARYAFQNLKGILRTMAGDVIVRKDLRPAIVGPWIWLNSRHTIHPSDPVNTFDWLMDQSEHYGLTSAFYFICGRTDRSKDALYDPEMPQVRALMRKVHERGHEIGLHPSYNTFNNPDEIRREADRLKKICCEEGIVQKSWGGRMHFLRWDQAVTPKAWSDAGMAYDSTLGYADLPGFRCGTCFEYPAFDIKTNQMLPLRIRPLVAMDCTVIAERYLGLGSTEAAFEKFNDLKNKCKAVSGVFTLLWHNSYFCSPEDFSTYRRLLANV